MMGKPEAGAKEISFLAMAARGYADAKGVSDLCAANSEMKQKMTERDAAAAATSLKALKVGKAKAAQQPDESEAESESTSVAEHRSSSKAVSKGGGSAASNHALDKKKAKERQAELEKEKKRLQKQKADVLAYCEAVIKEEGLSEEAAVARFFHLSRQSLKDAVRPASTASAAAKADYALLCDLLEGRQPQIVYDLGDEGFGSCSQLFELLAQNKELSARDAAPLWRELEAFSPSGHVEWSRLWIDSDSDVELVSNQGEAVELPTDSDEGRSAASFALALQSRQLLLRMQSTARGGALAAIASRLGRNEEEEKGLRRRLKEIASAPVPAALSHNQYCHVCELLPESLFNCGADARLCGADDKAADEGLLPCPRVRFGSVFECVGETPEGSMVVRNAWAAHCEPFADDGISNEVALEEVKQLSTVRYISSTGAQAEAGASFPSWENLDAVFSNPGALRGAQALYMNALPPPVESGEDGLGLEEDSLQMLRKMARDDICLALARLCRSQLLETTRVREVKRYVARCLGSLEKADQPLYSCLAELQPRQLVILARFVRSLWESNVSSLPHFLDSTDSYFRPSAYALDTTNDSLQPTPDLLTAVRTRAGEGTPTVRSFVDVLFNPLEDM